MSGFSAARGSEGAAPQKSGLAAVLPALLAGQVLSLVLASTAVATEELAHRGVNAPTTQSASLYVILALLFATRVVRERGGAPLRAVPWWSYALAAAVDVEANFLIVKAYQYADITSVQLLDCFTVPIVLVLSHVFLRRRFRAAHVLGAALCTGGLALLVVTDMGRNGDSSGRAKDPVKGDMLALAAAVLYAVSTVLQEHLVIRGGRDRYLAGLGCFGAAISTAQALSLELPALRAISWNVEIVFLFLGFTAAMTVQYCGTAVLMRMRGGGAVTLNLSFLTADFWSLLAGIFLFGVKLSPMYFFAFALTITGLGLYGIVGEAKSPQTDEISRDEHNRIDEAAALLRSRSEDAVREERGSTELPSSV